jgi:hypothetical protein
MDRILERWGAGEIPVLVTHSQSCSHGIDGLQVGGRRMIWLGPIWSSDTHQQTEARIERSGSGKETVIITTIIAVNTIDEVIAAALASRLRGEAAFLDMLADYLKRKHPKQAQDIEERLREARKRMGEAHPDKGGTSEAFREARAEYERVKEEAR